MKNTFLKSAKVYFFLIFLFSAPDIKSQNVEWTWSTSLPPCSSPIDSIVRVEVYDALNNLLGSSILCCGSAQCITGLPSYFIVYELSGISYRINLNIGPLGSCISPNGNCPTSSCGFNGRWTTTYVPGGSLCGTPSQVLTLDIQP